MASSTSMKGGVWAHTAFSAAFRSCIHCSIRVPRLFLLLSTALTAASSNSCCPVAISTALCNPTCCRQQFLLPSASLQYPQLLVASLRWSPDVASDACEAGKWHHILSLTRFFGLMSSQLWKLPPGSICLILKSQNPCTANHPFVFPSSPCELSQILGTNFLSFQ